MAKILGPMPQPPQTQSQQVPPIQINKEILMQLRPDSIFQEFIFSEQEQILARTLTPLKLVGFKQNTQEYSRRKLLK